MTNDEYYAEDYDEDEFEPVEFTKLKVFMAILTLALVVLANTNPPREYYIAYAKTQMLGTGATGIGTLIANSLIDSTTTEKNLYFGTLYTTHYGQREVLTLGAFGKFIPLK